MTRWVLEGRLKAYRISDSPKSPLLFMREDCMTALQAVPVEPVHLKERLLNCEKEEYFSLRQKDASKELDALLKIRTGKSRKA